MRKYIIGFLDMDETDEKNILFEDKDEIYITPYSSLKEAKKEQKSFFKNRKAQIYRLVKIK